ncbi:restriction endonuclease subunit S [Streptantibioticus parmotrematis]|uniref:restriction endonuclease subunit S n=1 Tax=Streptantibioticus parmotrematis TaxID=2873249 RepID=UPI0033CA224C
MSNKELPPGWVQVTLGDIATSVKNGLSVSRPGSTPDGIPILRIGAVRPMRLSLDDLRYTGQALEEIQGKDGLVEAGDLLFTRYNGNPALVGACARVPDGAPHLSYPDKLIRVRLPAGAVDSRFVCYAWAWADTQDQLRRHVRTTAGQAGISGSSLKGISLPLPPFAEQQRIVEALEDQLSRLDAAEKDLKVAYGKVSAFRKAVLLTLVPEQTPDSWDVTTVGEAGSIDLGRQRHPDWHHGPEMRPYLRVANVFEDRIDADDVMEMDFSGVFERYKLEPGDVLLNEGQSPHLVGRPALYRGQPAGVAFTNSLLRFRARADVLPEWALMVFRRHLHARRFMREVRITTNIAHLSAKRLKAVEFPIPPLEEQKRLVQRCDELLVDADALEKSLGLGLRRAQSLRKSLLNRAITGALAMQDSKDGSGEDLLDRIRGQREAAKNAKSGRGGRKRKPTSSTESEQVPAPPATASTIPRNAIQQEFEL